MPAEPQLPWHRPCPQIAQTEGDSSSMGLYQASTGQGSPGLERAAPCPAPDKKSRGVCLQCPVLQRWEGGSRGEFRWGRSTAKPFASLSLSGCHSARSSGTHPHRGHGFRLTCQETLRPPLDQRPRLFPISHPDDTHQIKAGTPNGPIKSSIFPFPPYWGERKLIYETFLPPPLVGIRKLKEICFSVAL